MDWTKETYSLDYLRDTATSYDFFNKEGSMLQFLKYSEVIPMDVEWKRGNALPQTSLDARAIPAQYLAEVAFDYDKDGFSHAADFIEVLEFEVADTLSNNIVKEVMTDLGRDS